MELAMMVGGTGAMGAAGAAAGSGILWAPAGMSLAGAASAGIPLVADAAAGAGLLSQLSSGLSFASMAMDLFGGMSAAADNSRALMQQSREMELQAKQEELRGKQEANDILDNMIQTVAQQRLAFAGTGMDTSFGTPAAIEANTRRLAEAQLGTSRDNTRMMAMSRRRQAANLLIERSTQGRSDMLQGVARAGTTAADLIARRYNRG